MEHKLNTLENLALLHIAICGRSTIEEIASRCGCSRDRLYRLLPRLEKDEMIISFNIGRVVGGKQTTSYYKLYGIHYNYIEHMKRYFVNFVDPVTQAPTGGVEWSGDFPCKFVINTDVYEWDIEKQALLKNGKPMDTKENVQKEMGAWMRSKRGTGKSLKFSDGTHEEDIERTKNYLAKLEQDRVYQEFNNEQSRNDNGA